MLKKCARRIFLVFGTLECGMFEELSGKSNTAYNKCITLYTGQLSKTLLTFYVVLFVRLTTIFLFHNHYRLLLLLLLMFAWELLNSISKTNLFFLPVRQYTG